MSTSSGEEAFMQLLTDGLVGILGRNIPGNMEEKMCIYKHETIPSYFRRPHSNLRNGSGWFPFKAALKSDTIFKEYKI